MYDLHLQLPPSPTIVLHQNNFDGNDAAVDLADALHYTQATDDNEAAQSSDHNQNSGIIFEHQYINGMYLGIYFPYLIHL